MYNEIYHVGDQVTVVGDGFDKQCLAGISTITGIEKKKIILKSGSEWSIDGCALYSKTKQKWYNGPYIRHTKPEDTNEIRRYRTIKTLTHMESKDWIEISDTDVFQIRSILAKYEKPTP